MLKNYLKRHHLYSAWS